MKILINLTKELKFFYKFLSIHTILVGLFQVLLPSFLWSLGIGIVKLSMFIAITGLGFVISLIIWEWIYHKYSFQKIIIISFVVQIIFMSFVFNENSYLFILAILNGAYNCFFWISQRALFFDTINADNSGKRFGNFQIFVAIMLNISVIIGAVLLEKFGFSGVYVVSTLVAILAIVFYLKKENSVSVNHNRSVPLKVKEIIFFNDKFGSKYVFFIDGLFLFLESYFWVVSLFIISRESFLTLGVLIVSLAGILAIIFYLIKNIIDKYSKNIIYKIGVLMYLLSWLLRTQIEAGQELLDMFFLVIIITFNTAFFRLAFNKRFFDIAKYSHNHSYLFIKSYQSQSFIAISFAIIAIMATQVDNFHTVLTNSYFMAAILAVSYFFYKEPKPEV